MTISDMSSSHKTALPAPEQVRAYLLGLQTSICEALENVEAGSEIKGVTSGKFKHDDWQRQPEEGAATPQLSGEGCARVMEGGGVFEKAGINFSDVSGQFLPVSATERKPELSGSPFRAMGVSLVIHPDNPFVPTTHANVRFFIAEPEGRDPVWWFGGGFDLTPYYPFWEDAHHWHGTARNACLPFGEWLYPEFKENCDRYFYLKHRNETRGVGGLFFDDWSTPDFTGAFGLTRSIGDHFLKAYLPIVEKRKDHPFGKREKAFQEYRRGRYVEFNLVYDRGTLFGLQSGGRTEAILMSLPPKVRWQYDWHPEQNSPEAELYNDFLKPRDWLGESHL